MPISLVNPLDETLRARGRRAPRLESLAGRTIGLLDISKPGGKTFLDYVEQALTTRWGAGRIVRATKPTFTKPAPIALLRELANLPCDAVLEALAD